MQTSFTLVVKKRASKGSFIAAVNNLGHDIRMASEMVEHFPPGHSPNRLATLVDGAFAKYFNI
jgi:hypothetical protein